MSIHSRALFLEKSHQFRISIRQQQLDTLFAHRRFILPTSPVPPNFSLFHIEFKSLSEPILQSSLNTLRASITSKEALPFTEVSKIGILTDLVEIIDKYPDNQMIAIDVFWVIGEFCSWESAYTEYYCKETQGFIEKTLHMLQKHIQNDDVSLMIFFTLTNILGSDPSQARLLLKHDILGLTIKVFELKRPLSLIQEATWFLSVFLDHRSRLPQKEIMNALPILVYCLAIEDPEVLKNSLQALKTFYRNADLAFIQKTFFVIERVLRILTDDMAEDVKFVLPGVEIFGSILSGSDEVARALIRKGVLDVLASKIEIESKPLRQSVCWCVGNILQCRAQDILMRVYRHTPLLSRCIDLAIRGNEKERRELLYGFIESLKNLRIDVIRALFPRGLNSILEEGLNSLDIKIRLLCLKGVRTLARRGEEIISLEEDGVNEMVVRMDEDFDLGRIVEGIYQEKSDGETHRLSLQILERYYYF